MILSDVLIEKGLLALSNWRKPWPCTGPKGFALDRAIVQLGLLTERQVLEVMSEQLHIPLINLDDIAIDPETLRSLPARIVYRKRLILPSPVERIAQCRDLRRF